MCVCVPIHSFLYFAAPLKENVNPVTNESTINPTMFKQILNKEKLICLFLIIT